MNLIINLDHDDWILSDSKATLASCGAVNETEYSLFNREAYEKFKANPEVSCDGGFIMETSWQMLASRIDRRELMLAFSAVGQVGLT